MKEVQPSFRVEWYKSCTPSFKLRQKERENSSKWYIEEVVQIMLMDTKKHFTSMGKILYNKK